MRTVKYLWILSFVSIVGACFVGADNIRHGIEHALLASGIIAGVTVVFLPAFVSLSDYR